VSRRQPQIEYRDRPAYYNKQEKVARLSTETARASWGSALSQACSFFGLQCKVYIVKSRITRKPYRRILMGFGAQVWRGPSRTPRRARRCSSRSGLPGSLGIAISEAVEDAATRMTPVFPRRVLNHVLMHRP